MTPKLTDCLTCKAQFVKRSSGHKYCARCVSIRKSEAMRRMSDGYKSGQIQKKRRKCIGIYCRGEKEFTSLFGHRVCRACREAAKSIEDYG